MHTTFQWGRSPMGLIQIGDKVKVFAQVGLMKESKWLVGSYLDDVPENSAMVEISGNRVIAQKCKVKKFIKATPEDTDKFTKNYWSPLKSIVALGVERLLGPNPPKLEINEEEYSISLQDGWISISPGIEERESIVEFAEHPCWTVSIAVSTGGGYWEPPDVDICDVGSCSNCVNAAQLFVETIWKETNRPFWESASFYDFSEATN